MDTLAVHSFYGEEPKHPPIDIKSGAVTILQDIGTEAIKYNMYLKVFKNSYEHHVQIYTDGKYIFLDDYVSLRKCRIVVSEEIRRISVIGSSCGQEHTCLAFEVQHEEDILEWVAALTSSSDLCFASSEFSPQISPIARRKSKYDIKISR